MNTEIKTSKIPASLKDTNQWLRILYMVLFGIIFFFVMHILFLVALVQAVFALLTGEPNKNLTDFGGKLSQYLNQMATFLTHNSEVKPFPFSAWGETEVTDTVDTNAAPEPTAAPTENNTPPTE